MSNSKLVSHTHLTRNSYGQRKYPITRITPHCVVGQCSVETLGNIFAPSSRRASCNYGIGSDGRVGMYVPENQASWCSSNADNDHRAVTIECASDTKAPYAMRSAVYNTLILLCADICIRNGKTKLLWLGSRSATEHYKQKSDEMVITVHRWYAAKSCPGDWLMQRMTDLCDRVNYILGSDTQTAKPKTAAASVKKNSTAVTATGKASKYAKYLSGTYTTTDDLNCRNNGNPRAKILGTYPRGTKVTCYGYYSTYRGTKWYYVIGKAGSTTITGFVNSHYLR